MYFYSIRKFYSLRNRKQLSSHRRTRSDDSRKRFVIEMKPRDPSDKYPP